MGMMPANLDGDDKNVQNNYCGDPNKNSQIKGCTAKFLNKKKLTDDYNKACLGKKTCTLNLAES